MSCYALRFDPCQDDIFYGILPLSIMYAISKYAMFAAILTLENLYIVARDPANHKFHLAKPQ